jgi:hypothetical protein
MKTKIRLLIFIIVTIVAVSCNDDFLKEKEELFYVSDAPLVISPQNEARTITMNIPNAGNQKFHLRTFPKWLEFDSLEGAFVNGQTALHYVFVHPGYETAQGYFSANMVIAVEDVGYFQIEVIYGDVVITNHQVPSIAWHRPSIRIKIP